MKKILILSICTLFFLTSITFAVNANIISITSNGNTPPNPPVITGPSSGKIREGYIYSVTVSDPDENDVIINIQISFGDGITTCGGCDGLGPWHSGDVQQFNHSWIRTGTFKITGRAEDEHGEWSKWSDPLPITMPYTNKPIPQFFESLFQRFPNAFPILQHLLGY
jgi:hypothetical protein